MFRKADWTFHQKPRHRPCYWFDPFTGEVEKTKCPYNPYTGDEDEGGEPIEEPIELLAMPTGKRKRATSKRTYKKKRRGSINRKSTINKRTGGFLGKEKKFIDYTLTGTAIPSPNWLLVEPATTEALSAVAQGNGPSNRDGLKMIAVSLYIRGFVLEASDANTAPESPLIWRMIVFVDKQTNATNPTPLDVVTSQAVQAPLNLANSTRFWVLKDIYQCQTQPSLATNLVANYATNGVARTFEFFKNFKLPIQHVGTTAAVASIANHAVRVMMVANRAGGLVTYTSRIRFYD